MTTGMHAVVVKQLPGVLNAKQKAAFLNEIGSVMDGNRPRLVLDCSGLCDCDGAVIQVLLDCLERALKRNGDVKLARVPPTPAIVLARTGVGRLFEIFDTTEEAVSSFHRLPAIPSTQPAVAGPSDRSSEDAA